MQFRVYIGYTFINSEKAFTQSECYKIQSPPTVWVFYYGSIISNYIELYLTYWDFFFSLSLTKILTYKLIQTELELPSGQYLLEKARYIHCLFSISAYFRTKLSTKI